MKTTSKSGHEKEISNVLPPISAVGVPVGSIIMYGGILDEEWLKKQGWLLCDGRELEMDSYADLYNAIRGSYGQAGTKFTIPDCRGMFVRGVDMNRRQDPDASQRGFQSTGGNSGDQIGSIQQDAFQNHYHQTDTINNSSSKDGMAGSNRRTSDRNTGGVYAPTSAGGNYGTPRYSSETRPVNIYFYFIIKFANV